MHPMATALAWCQVQFCISKYITISRSLGGHTVGEDVGTGTVGETVGEEVGYGVYTVSGGSWGVGDGVSCVSGGSSGVGDGVSCVSGGCVGQHL